VEEVEAGLLETALFVEMLVEEVVQGECLNVLLGTAKSKRSVKLSISVSWA